MNKNKYTIQSHPVMPVYGIERDNVIGSYDKNSKLNFSSGSRRLKKSRYITGFDGIRTLAVIGVIFYHLLPGSIKGGFLGVPIFFVVSGYLITDLLVQELEQNNNISISAFYERRIKRLYPGLVTMVFATTAYITLFQRQLLKHIRMVILTNLTYVYNWYEIIHQQSYFDKFGTPCPFTHLWSLSIEGQFYFIWPIVIVLLFRYIRKKTTIFALLMTLTIGSAILMGVLYQPETDPSRVYYGTDTRMFSILIGAGLAIIWPSSHLRKNLSKGNRLFIDILGLLSLAGILIMYTFTSGESTFVYRGGMFLFSILSAFFVAAVAHPGADMNRLMTNKLFTWIGKRSYGIYLYQYPVMVFYESHVNIGEHLWWNIMIEMVIILIISALSYRFIEQPLRHFDYSHTWNKIKEFFQPNLRVTTGRICTLLMSVIFCIATYGAIIQPKPKNDAEAYEGKQLQNHIKNNQAAVAKRNAQLKKEKVGTPVTKSPNPPKEVLVDKDGHVTPAGQKVAQNMQITAVGDSVMADASSVLQKEFPNMYIDAKVGRQASAAPAILQSLKDQNRLAPNVLLSLGTNGTVSQSDLDKIMEIVGKNRNVYWLNVHVPTRTWQDEVNSTLKDAANKYPNLHILDWYDYSNGKNDWFYADNVHPNENGLKYYGDFVLRSILEDQQKNNK